MKCLRCGKQIVNASFCIPCVDKLLEEAAKESKKRLAEFQKPKVMELKCTCCPVHGQRAYGGMGESL